MEKKEWQLQPRLALLASLVTQGSSIADVGTDHGYLPVWLLLHGMICRAVASDINREPLEHARRTAQEYGISENLSFRLCAGLDAITPQEVDTVIIAGMGGETIIGILSAAPWAREKTLLLQPMTKAELLRVWLADHDYAIREEHLVCDKDALYAVITATAGEREVISPAKAYCGLRLQGDPLYGRYLRERIEKLERAADGLRRSKLPDKNERIAPLEETLRELRESEREWSHDNSR